MNEVFREIWDDNHCCDICRKARQSFAFEEPKRGLGDRDNKCVEYEKTKWARKQGVREFSPPYPGFINPNFVDKPSEFLGKGLFFILESLGGTREWPLKSSSKVEDVVSELQSYYLDKKPERFHQFCIRNLLGLFQSNPYVVTDTIKCYCRKTDENFNEAMKHCSKHLKRQLFAAKPTIVVPIGRLAAKALSGMASADSREEIGNIGKLKHGQKFENIVLEKENGSRMNISMVYCRFPTAKTADYWVKDGQEKKIFDSIKELQRI